MSIDLYGVKLTDKFDRNVISTWWNTDDDFETMVSRKLSIDNLYRDISLDRYDYEFLLSITDLKTLGDEPCCTRRTMKYIANKLNEWEEITWNRKNYSLKIDFNEGLVIIPKKRIKDLIEYITIINELEGVLWIDG